MNLVVLSGLVGAFLGGGLCAAHPQPTELRLLSTPQMPFVIAPAGG